MRSAYESRLFNPHFLLRQTTWARQTLGIREAVSQVVESDVRYM